MLTADKVAKRFLEGLEKLADKGKFELAQQGHKATGEGIASIEAKITSESLKKLVGVVLANDYLELVDTGVKPEKIPFGGTSRGGTSKYIQALIDWVLIIKPALEESERLSFVFAIANTHKSTGIPTMKSTEHSQNGRRKNWIKYGLEDNEQDFTEEFQLFDLIVDSFDEAIAVAQRA